MEQQRSAQWSRLLSRVLAHPWLVVSGLLASVAGAGAAAAWARVAGPALEGLVLERSPALAGLPVLLVALAVVKGASGLAAAGLTGRLGQRVLGRLRSELYGKLLTFPPGWFEARHSGELLGRFTADVAQVEVAASQLLTVSGKDLLTVVALLGVCASLDVRLFILVFLVLPATVLPVSAFARSARRAAGRAQASVGALSTLLAEQLHGLAVVQAFRGEARALARFDEEHRRYLAAMRRSLFIRGAFSPTTELLGMVGVAVAVVAGARAVDAEPELASRLVSFFAATLLLYQPVKALAGAVPEAARATAALARLHEILDEPVVAAAGTSRLEPLEHRLVFEDVVVRYPDGREGLSGLSLTVDAGAMVALVGPSGAGKSTAVSLLLGHVGASGGRVLWDGVELGSVEPAALRAQVAWVPQEPLLLSGTVRENLLLGRAGASDEELWEALEQASAASVVRALPGGLDGEVGEGGRRLSGGQRQRLALARAFLKGSSLLLLDEPTSALDPESEVAVERGLSRLMAGRTVVVVAHRLSTVRRADRIVVLDRGRAVEAGTHDELVAAGGLYAALAAHAFEAPVPG